MIKIRTLQFAKGLAREAAAHKAYLRKHGHERDYPQLIIATPLPIVVPTGSPARSHCQQIWRWHCG